MDWAAGDGLGQLVPLERVTVKQYVVILTDLHPPLTKHFYPDGSEPTALPTTTSVGEFGQVCFTQP